MRSSLTMDTTTLSGCRNPKTSLEIPLFFFFLCVCLTAKEKTHRFSLLLHTLVFSLPCDCILLSHAAHLSSLFSFSRSSIWLFLSFSPLLCSLHSSRDALSLSLSLKLTYRLLYTTRFPHLPSLLEAHSLLMQVVRVF